MQLVCSGRIAFRVPAPMILCPVQKGLESQLKVGSLQLENWNCRYAAAGLHKPTDCPALQVPLTVQAQALCQTRALSLGSLAGTMASSCQDLCAFLAGAESQVSSEHCSHAQSGMTVLACLNLACAMQSKGRFGGRSCCRIAGHMFS